MRPYLLYCGDLCNLGDLALVLQNLEHLPAGAKAYVRRWAPLPPEVEQQVMAAGGILVDSRRIVAFVRLAASCDIIIGGGQLVRDNVSLPSLIAQYAGARVARWHGGRVATRGLGVGVIRERKRRLLWKALLRLAPEVRVRDAQSLENAAALIGRDRVVQTADMAFVPSKLHARAANGAARRDRIIVSPCVDGSEQRSMSFALLAGVLHAASARLPNQEIVFACHDPRPEMDVAASRALIAELALPDARVVDGFHLDALLDEYRHASLVITNRLHPMIFALLADCAIIVIDDLTAKTRFVADRFVLPTVAPGDTMDDGASVLRALDHVAGSRRDALATMGRSAVANLG